MNYKNEIIKSMEWLSKKSNTIFLGQAVAFSGHALSATISNIPLKKKIRTSCF